MKKGFSLLIAVIFMTGLCAVEVKAQWGIGASYEIRNESPKSGFGVRVEREILSVLPILDLNIRGHFSTFSEENSISSSGVSYSNEFNVYDYGAALVLGADLGIVKPYLGAGLGSERFKFSSGFIESDFSESNFYWNGFGGAEVTLLPFLKPFIEFRYSKLMDTDDVEFDEISRLAIGVNLRF